MTEQLKDGVPSFVAMVPLEFHLAQLAAEVAEHAETRAERDELDFILHEGGEDSVARLIARLEAAEARIVQMTAAWGEDAVRVEELTAEVAQMREALARPRQVKSLKWKFFDIFHPYGRGVHDANFVGGTYTIADCGDHPEVGPRFYVEKLSASFASLDDAKAAAQDDYEARIHAALQ